MTKTDLTFPAFSLRFVDFAIQFCFRCKLYSTRIDAGVKFDSVMIFLDQSHFLCYTLQPMRLLLFVETTDYVKWLFSCSPKWTKGGFRVMLKDFEIKSFLCISLFCYYMKQVDSMLPCFCSAIDHRRRQNVVRRSVKRSAIASCATFSFLLHFDVISDLLLNRHTATWNRIC